MQVPRRLLDWASVVDDKDAAKRIANSDPFVGQSKRTGAPVREWGDDGECCRQAGCWDDGVNVRALASSVCRGRA